MINRRVGIATLAALALLMPTACSSTSSSSSSAASSGAAPPASSAPATSAAANSAPASSAAGSSAAASSPAGSSAAVSSATADPTLIKGKTVWYADITDANPLVQDIAQAMNDTITANGGTMVRSFAINNTTGQLDLGVQSDAVTRAVSSKPAAIAYFVIDPKSLKPQVTKAKAAGIPVFAVFGKPDGFDVNAYINLADEQQGYLAAKYLADNLPKGAKVAIIGGPPTPNVTAELVGANKALTEAGVTIVGNASQQQDLTDNSAGGQTVMQGILQRFPDVQGVFAYNDDAALGAIAAAKAANKQVKFSARNGSTAGVAAVKARTLLATCDIDPIALGHEVGQAIVDQISGTKTVSDNAQLPSPDASKCVIDKDNVSTWKPYDQTIKTG